jgi:2-polyprenyl-3-methyl-5-hydroxy-6-metoxy-1,4-benzoquinol methylase
MSDAARKTINPFEKVRETEYGYFELREKPSPTELKEYYANKYFQQSIRVHEKTYSENEIQFRKNKLEQKRLKTEALAPELARGECRFLDIGAGEGFAMAHFVEAGWNVTGLDHSRYGCETHHPQILDKLVVGDVGDSLRGLENAGERYELVLMDNILEHVLEPLDVLKTVRSLLTTDGLLIIEVPNDFSKLQMRLIEMGVISEPCWVAIPDHISYFNHEGLKSLAEAAGLKQRSVMADFPIDFALFNPLTNYMADKGTGKSCHTARVEIENMMHAISVEGVNTLYESLAGLGLGRQITGFFSLA